MSGKHGRWRLLSSMFPYRQKNSELLFLECVLYGPPPPSFHDFLLLAEEWHHSCPRHTSISLHLSISARSLAPLSCNWRHATSKNRCCFVWRATRSPSLNIPRVSSRWEPGKWLDKWFNLRAAEIINTMQRGTTAQTSPESREGPEPLSHAVTYSSLLVHITTLDVTDMDSVWVPHHLFENSMQSTKYIQITVFNSETICTSTCGARLLFTSVTVWRKQKRTRPSVSPKSNYFNHHFRLG